MTPRKLFINTNIPLSSLMPQIEATVNTSPAGQLLEKFLRLPLWGALLAAVVIWAAQQGGFPLILSSWTTLSTLIVPLMPNFFAVIVPLVANPMYSLLCLLGVFFSTVIFYLVNGAEYLGLTLMIVYVGAVAVIFLFVLMLLNAKDQAEIKDLLVHMTQYLAIIVIAALFGRVGTQVYKPVEAFATAHEARFSLLEPTSGEAVEFFVRYQFNDISSIVPLYTHHGILFVVLTAILLAALLGAIILATQTTERPVLAQVACEPPLAGANATFFVIALALPISSSYSALADTNGLSAAVFALLPLSVIAAMTLPIHCKKWYPRLPSDSRGGAVPPSRYWRWRSARAASLLRVKGGVWDPRARTTRAFRAGDFIYGRWTGRLMPRYDLLVPTKKRGLQIKRSVIATKLKTPIRPSHLGICQYFIFVWQTRVEPAITFCAWRICFFCPVFVLFLIVFPLAYTVLTCVFTDHVAAYFDSVLREDLCAALSSQSNFYKISPQLIRELIASILLFPVAFCTVFVEKLGWWIFAAAFFAVDLTDLAGNRYTVYPQNLKTAAEYSQAKKDYFNPPEIELTAEELAYSKRHPDKGRTDFNLVFLGGSVAATKKSLIDESSPIYSLYSNSFYKLFEDSYAQAFGLIELQALLLFLAYLYAVSGIVLFVLRATESQDDPEEYISDNLYASLLIYLLVHMYYLTVFFEPVVFSKLSGDIKAVVRFLPETYAYLDGLRFTPHWLVEDVYFVTSLTIIIILAARYLLKSFFAVVRARSEIRSSLVEHRHFINNRLRATPWLPAPAAVPDVTFKRQFFKKPVRHHAPKKIRISKKNK